MDLAADLREVYDLLRERMRAEKLSGTEAANLAREIRQIGERLELLEPPQEESVVIALHRERAEAGGSRPAARRRKSG